MRNWKNWLFPILTGLTVTALALLPLRLSTLEDGKLTGAVHTEALPENSNFPSAPPELPGRLWLLVQCIEKPDTLTIMAQTLEEPELEREIQRLHEALNALNEILPPQAAETLEQIDMFSCDRYYLRDQTDLSSASFSFFNGYDRHTNAYLSAQLDGVSGQLVGLHVSSLPESFAYRLSARETGEKLLDHLGLSYEPEETVDGEGLEGAASFRLPEWNGQFLLSQNALHLDFNFLVDWSAVDQDIAEAYGYGPTDSDASQMQIPWQNDGKRQVF